MLSVVSISLVAVVVMQLRLSTAASPSAVSAQTASAQVPSVPPSARRSKNLRFLTILGIVEALMIGPIGSISVLDSSEAYVALTMSVGFALMSAVNVLLLWKRGKDRKLTMRIHGILIVAVIMYRDAVKQEAEPTK